MAWLRIDDGFTENAKIAQLTDGEFRVWMRLLCWAARQRAAKVTTGLCRELVGLNPTKLRRYVQLGLLDANGDGYTIHEFLVYNATTIEEKVAAYIEHHPDAAANEIYRAVGGKRELVLAIVKKTRRPGSQNGSGEPHAGGAPGGSPEPGVAGSKEPPSAVHARAVPAPTPEDQEQEPSLSQPVARPPDPAAHDRQAGRPDHEPELEHLGTEAEHVLAAARRGAA